MKKGQAFMEFIQVYGWAILAAIIVIGILGYYYFNQDALNTNDYTCLSEKFCNDYNYLFDYYGSDVIYCKYITEDKDTIEIKFIDVDFNDLNKRFECP